MQQTARNSCRLGTWPRWVATPEMGGWGIPGVVHLETDVGDRLLGLQLYIPLFVCFLATLAMCPVVDALGEIAPQKGGPREKRQLNFSDTWICTVHQVCYLLWTGDVDGHRISRMGETCPQSGRSCTRQSCSIACSVLPTFADSSSTTRCIHT